MLINNKAISTLIFIILLLFSAVFGACISYLWVMAAYYNMPEDMTLLIVTDVSFDALNATHFNVTILNPSNSFSDVNLTAIRVIVKDKNEADEVKKEEAEPSLPFLMRKGTKQTFKCMKNWSNFTGETITIEPVAMEASTKSCSYQTPNLKLRVFPDFNVSESIKYFNITIKNEESSVINVTISDILVFSDSIKENVTPSLNLVNFLQIGQSLTYTCDYNWERLMTQNVTVTVKTTEGYEVKYTTNQLPAAFIHIENISFDYSDVEHFYINISSTEDSTTFASIGAMNMTLEDGTRIPINQTFPQIGPPTVFNSIPPNSSINFQCSWNWESYRNKTIMIEAYTNEGFTIQAKNVTTPPEIVWNITDVKFDFDYTDYFLVNITNMWCSISNVTITQIMLNGNATSITPTSAVLVRGSQITFNCSINWRPFIGKNVTIIAIKEDGANISRTIEIPPVQLKLDKPAISELLGPYVNITISNSINSIQNVTITAIVFETENRTDLIDGTLTIPALVPDGYVLKVGETVTITCRWNWALYLQFSLRVTVYTAEGFQASEVWHPPF